MLPALVATALHRLDINLRISVVLGFVGVDGIGYAIANAFKSIDYRRGMALAAVVLVLCIVVELLSGAIRRALLRDSGERTAATAPTNRGDQISSAVDEPATPGARLRGGDATDRAAVGRGCRPEPDHLPQFAE